MGREQVLAQQEEYRVAALARSGKEAVLSELSGLLGRLSALVRRKGTASEVTSLLRQLPSLLASLKTKPTDDLAVPGGLIYESAPNHDAQVYVRLATNGFALLAPLLRPMPKGSRGGAGGRGEERPRSAHSSPIRHQAPRRSYSAPRSRRSQPPCATAQPTCPRSTSTCRSWCRSCAQRRPARPRRRPWQRRVRDHTSLA